MPNSVGLGKLRQEERDLNPDSPGTCRARSSALAAYCSLRRKRLQGQNVSAHSQATAVLYGVLEDRQNVCMRCMQMTKAPAVVNVDFCNGAAALPQPRCWCLLLLSAYRRSSPAGRWLARQAGLTAGSNHLDTLEVLAMSKMDSNHLIRLEQRQRTQLDPPRRPRPVWNSHTGFETKHTKDTVSGQPSATCGAALERPLDRRSVTRARHKARPPPAWGCPQVRIGW